MVPSTVVIVPAGKTRQIRWSAVSAGARDDRFRVLASVRPVQRQTIAMDDLEAR
jgi:hypothetical protein